MPKSLKRLIPIPFWAALIGSIAYVTRGDLGMDDNMHFGVFGGTWVLVILTVMGCHTVFVGRKAIGSPEIFDFMRGMQIPLSFAFVLATIVLPVFGVMYAAVNPPTGANATPVRDLIMLGAGPYLIAIIVTAYAGLEKVVEDSHQEDVLAEGSGWIAGTVGSLATSIATIFRAIFFWPLKILAFFAIGRDGSGDRVEESSTLGMLLTLALYVTFTALVLLHYRAFSTTTFNYSFLELSSWDIFLFSADNVVKSLAGDFPSLFGMTIGDAVHDSSNVFFTVLVGIFRFFFPIAILLLIMGKKAK